MSTSLKDVQAAKSQAAKVFSNLLGEVAVGIMKIGHNRFCLKINSTAQPAAGLALPSEIDGVPVRVEIVGRIRKR